jgi:Asp-tRNA(Asn)/Glu-tRNA(Gln) amidotransferase A subunit family amidase
MNDLNFLPAASMAEQIRKKRISPVELVDAHLAQIEKLNPKLNALVQLDAAQARRTAHDAETAVMQEKPLGPLHGVPISIKSSISVAGMPCESGPHQQPVGPGAHARRFQRR